MRGYLLTAFIISLWMESSCGIDIQLVPSHPLINKSVTLNVRGITGTVRAFRWYFGSNPDASNQILHYNPNSNPPQTPGDQYFHRAHGLANGSLHISDLVRTDQGNYMVMILARDIERVTVYLPIYESVTKPVIRCSTPRPKVNETVSLTCETANSESILWSKDSNSLHSRVDLSPDNRTAILRNIILSDTGEYQCEAKNAVSRSVSDIFTLIVNYNEPISDNCAASMAGIICGTIIGIVLIICTTFLLFKRYILPMREAQQEQPTERQDSYRIYYNVFATTMAQPAKEELPYMGLEYPTQDTYSELSHQ
ncbi:carcinoembryonic antigen-related cell adhesion molecule 7 [Xenopus laevis]|uniref:Carcinoembryonic antigen-related cell adhesion molecule 7 n=2 Tax=Xenopus laevis TaxID=8355 RepID=A0A1L8FN83_XENLA|nr:carcinoembryonic antigen-related cell adhesion molecule 7 [Xenopus laevis]OCT73037.1 hypothetical protein XELAEV_18036016mg [Xenopus laevis]